MVVKALGGEEIALAKDLAIQLPGEQSFTEETALSNQHTTVYRFPPGCTIRYPWGKIPSYRTEGFFLQGPAKDSLPVNAGVVTLPAGWQLLVRGSSWGTFTISCTIPIALFVGLYMYRIRPGHVVEASILGAAATLGAVVLGSYIPGSVLEEYFSLGKGACTLSLVVYGFMASVLPVWMLLCPRDYLSSFLKIGTIILLIVSVVIANPLLRSPLLNEQFSNGGPTFPGPIFPFVFICIMCGSISGFHALVSSGTTPKMIEKESQIRPIGYGAMLMEGVVGIVALIAAASLEPRLYYDVNVPQGKVAELQPELDKLYRALGVDDVSHLPVESDLNQVENIMKESLRGRVGGAVTLAVGMSFILRDATRWAVDPTAINGLMKYWFHFAIMFEALFILTTIDTGTRIARFLLQETMGAVYRPLGRPDFLPGAVLSTALVTAGWGILVYTGSIDTIWPMFGIANQLLSVVALALVTTWLVNSGRSRYVALTIVPMLFVCATTLTAAAEMIGFRFPSMMRSDQPGVRIKGLLSLPMTVFVVVCVLTLLLLAVARWISVWMGAVEVRKPGEGVEVKTLDS